jgi:hypothetical protein
MITSKDLACGLQNMVTNLLSERVLCDQSAIRLMVLETEIKFLRKQLEEAEREN